jgi:hypothetical protein
MQRGVPTSLADTSALYGSRKGKGRRSLLAHHSGLGISEVPLYAPAVNRPSIGVVKTFEDERISPHTDIAEGVR